MALLRGACSEGVSVVGDMEEDIVLGDGCGGGRPTREAEIGRIEKVYSRIWSQLDVCANQFLPSF